MMGVVVCSHPLVFQNGKGPDCISHEAPAHTKWLPSLTGDVVPPAAHAPPVRHRARQRPGQGAGRWRNRWLRSGRSFRGAERCTGFMMDAWLLSLTPQ
ncbi:unnamed protein product [Caretta caretta]